MENLRIRASNTLPNDKSPKCADCKHSRDRHEIEPPYPCYDCDCEAFSHVAPSSSPLETPSQPRPICDECGKTEEYHLAKSESVDGLEAKRLGFHHFHTRAESSPKPAESPFETQTGRIFAQLNTVCFHSRMHGDCVGCLLGHAERLEIALNEGATPSPEPKPADPPDMVWVNRAEYNSLRECMIEAADEIQRLRTPSPEPPSNDDQRQRAIEECMAIASECEDDDKTAGAVYMEIKNRLLRSKD